MEKNSQPHLNPEQTPIVRVHYHCPEGNGHDITETKPASNDILTSITCPDHPWKTASFTQMENLSSK